MLDNYDSYSYKNHFFKNLRLQKKIIICGQIKKKMHLTS